MSLVTGSRLRSSRRKSAWNLVLIPAVFGSWAGLWYMFVALAERVHSLRFGGQPFLQAKGLGSILTAVGSLSAALPLAMLVGNAFVWLVPQPKRALDQEAAQHPRTSFHASQRSLLRLATFMVPPSLAVAMLGALMSWR